MKFLIVYFIAFFLTLIFGTIMEWMENKKGNRAITGKNALIIIGMALIPVVNIVVAIVAVALSVALLLDTLGFFTWVENALYRLQKITLFTDRK